MTSYVERSYSHMIEVRLRLRGQVGAQPSASDTFIKDDVYGIVFSAPTLRLRIWALLHGYGWPKVIG